MKNHKKTSKIIKNIFTFLILGLMTVYFGKASEKIENSNCPEPTEEISYTNSVLNRLKQKVNEGYIFSAQISSSTVKKNKNIEMAFTTFGMGPLHLKKDGKFYVDNIKTAFNDRNNFQGKKTIESLVLSSNGNNVKVIMKFHTWSNQTVELTNVKIIKERHGYFATGIHKNGSKTVYYTIVISHRGRLI